MKMPVLNIPSKGARFNLLCMMAALLNALRSGWGPDR